MEHLYDSKIKELELVANDIRQTIIKMLVAAGSGHTAGPLGMADIFTVLYFHSLRHDPLNPDWPDRDRVILSNGHICPVLYATMAHRGYFSVNEVETTLRKFGSRFQGHPHREWLPQLETSSGPLGSGLSQAVGVRRRRSRHRRRYPFRWHRRPRLSSPGETHWFRRTDPGRPPGSATGRPWIRASPARTSNVARSSPEAVSTVA